MKADEEVDRHHKTVNLHVECNKMLSSVLSALNSFQCLSCLCVQSVATAVAQLFMALPHSPSMWSLQQTGVVCFVKDNPKRSYFIRMFDLKVNSHTVQHVCWFIYDLAMVNKLSF